LVPPPGTSDVAAIAINGGDGGVEGRISIKRANFGTVGARLLPSVHQLINIGRGTHHIAWTDTGLKM
jgi:hypothetical protein